jgi:polypeptide N-acetylgalactosaminyltransferase
MNHKTFKPTHTGYGYRGMFDWNFRYQWFPLRPEDTKEDGEPFQLPCLTGGHYAIRRDHFFYLGGYDEGLQIWNGENWELCLKLWLCKGGLVHTPCSRVTHLSKLHSAHRYDAVQGDFVGRNLKRVAEVWLDDYKQYFYRGDPQRFAKIDPGDLTKQFEKKKSLQCKPFSYYTDVIAPDFLMRYPITPRHFAAGKIESQVSKKCIKVSPNLHDEPLTLEDCNRTHATDLILSVERSIRLNDTNDQCLKQRTLTFSNCHHMHGDQMWRFFLDTRQIANPPTNLCLTANNTHVVEAACDSKLPQQKWKWAYENVTALMDWENSGV